MERMNETQHAQLIKMARAHQKADEYKSGHYEWADGACSIGCSIHDLKRLNILTETAPQSGHKHWGEFSGIGEVMANLQDAIFEGLSGDRQTSFTPEVVEALRPGADYSMFWPKFAIWLLRQLPKADEFSDVASAVEGVAKLYEEWLETKIKPNAYRWAESAESAESAAWAAWAAWAESAAWAARAARAESAESAALITAMIADAAILALTSEWAPVP